MIKVDLSTLEPFDVIKAKHGAAVCTQEGYMVRILCFNRGTSPSWPYPLVALVRETATTPEAFIPYDINGNRFQIPILVPKNAPSERFTTEPLNLRIVPGTEDSWSMVVRNEKGETWLEPIS